VNVLMIADEDNTASTQARVGEAIAGRGGDCLASAISVIWRLLLASVWAAGARSRAD